MVLSASPTPKQFASAWHKGLKKAVLEVSSPTRITKAQAERIGEDDPQQAIYRDNVLNYLAARHVGSTKLDRLFAAGYSHALGEGERVQGPNKKISLAEARKMATDLVDDFYVLRGKGPAPAPVSLPTTADIQDALAVAVQAVSPYWDSGDNGVNVTVSALPGAHSLGKALLDLPHNPDTPWTAAETKLTLSNLKGADAVAAFAAEAKDAMDNFSSDFAAETTGFAQALTASFAGLSDVRSATGQDLGGRYLLGKTADSYVVVIVQPYSDG